MERGLRVLFVENDPALLGLLGQSLVSNPKIQSLVTARNSDEALAAYRPSQIDVALLDVGLGAGSMNGVDLGIHLRGMNEHVGIVLLSQNSTGDLISRLDPAIAYGWSSILKSADLSIGYLVEVLVATAQGMNVIDPKSVGGSTEMANSEALTSKQRRIMALAATGIEATEIAAQLGYAPVTVRQELSRIYKILVPNPKPGTDLRTTAVLNYLRETKWSAQG